MGITNRLFGNDEYAPPIYQNAIRHVAASGMLYWYAAQAKLSIPQVAIAIKERVRYVQDWFSYGIHPCSPTVKVLGDLLGFTVEEYTKEFNKPYGKFVPPQKKHEPEEDIVLSEETQKKLKALAQKIRAKAQEEKKLKAKTKTPPKTKPEKKIEAPKQKNQRGRKIIDLTGQRFGKLLVLGLSDRREAGCHGHVFWRCLCDCGNEEVVSSSNIKKKTACVRCSLRGRKLIDLTGQKFGKLTVIRRVIGDDNHTRWECRCDCGNTKVVCGGSLMSGATKTCGCSRRKPHKAPVSRIARKGCLMDLTGLKFGKLTVIKRAENRNGKVCWECRCDCGTVLSVRANDLRQGSTKSCGCLRVEKQNAKEKERK